MVGVDLRSPTLDKSRELDIVKNVYSAELIGRLMPSEQPDFLVGDKDKSEGGIEVTEFYMDHSEARLRNIPGYGTHLIECGEKKHKEDVDGIRVEEVVYTSEEKNISRKITAIIRERPPFTDVVTKLNATIASKEDKLDDYSKKAAALDLVVMDESYALIHMLDKEHSNAIQSYFYANMYDAVTKSRFREIYLVFKVYQAGTKYIPLSTAIFGGYSNALAKELNSLVKDKTVEGRKVWVEALVRALILKGFSAFKASFNPSY